MFVDLYMGIRYIRDMEKRSFEGEGWEVGGGFF